MPVGSPYCSGRFAASLMADRSLAAHWVVSETLDLQCEHLTSYALMQIQDVNLDTTGVVDFGRQESCVVIWGGGAYLGTTGGAGFGRRTSRSRGRRWRQTLEFPRKTRNDYINYRIK